MGQKNAFRRYSNSVVRLCWFAICSIGVAGCGDLSWPVERADHRAHQGYGNYQDGDIHNGLDAVGVGDGPQVPPFDPYDVANVLAARNNFRMWNCVSYPKAAAWQYVHDAWRELQPAFREEGQARYATYGHTHELPLWNADGTANANYVLLWRHHPVAGAGAPGQGGPADAVCIQANDGVTDSVLGGDDHVDAAGNVWCGNNGICESRVRGDDTYVFPFYYQNGGDGANRWTNPEYWAANIRFTKGQRFGRISNSWGPTTVRPGAHIHFSASTNGTLGNTPMLGTFFDHTQNPLKPAALLGYSGKGYDPLDITPEIGPLIIKEAGTNHEVSPDPVTPPGGTPIQPHIQSAVELVVEVVDRLGGEQKAWGGRARRDQAEANSWYRDLARTSRQQNRWAGIAGAAFRTEYHIEGVSVGVTDRNIGTSQDPLFIAFQGEMHCQDGGGNALSLNGNAGYLYDASAGRTSGLYIAGYPALWTNCLRLTSIVRGGYLRAGVDPPNMVRLDNNGRWNTKARNATNDRDWQNGTADAQVPINLHHTTVGVPSGQRNGWEFPDGVYRLHVTAKDTEDHSASDAWYMRVDNWCPRILKLTLEVNAPTGGWKTVYEYNWEAYVNKYAESHSYGDPVAPYPQADLIQGGLRGHLLAAGSQARVTIQFSESMRCVGEAPPSGYGPYVKAVYTTPDTTGTYTQDLMNADGTGGSWANPRVYTDDTWTCTFTVPSQAASPSGATGDLRFQIRLADVVGKRLDKDGDNVQDTEDDNHIIDFRPRLERVFVYQGKDGSGNDICVEKKQFRIKSDRTGLELDTTDGGSISKWISYSAGDVKIEAQFSEPMADSPSVELLKKDGLWGSLGNLTAKAGSGNTIWEKANLLTKTLMKDDVYYGKERWFRVTGAERKTTGAQSLDGVPGTTPTYTPNATYTGGTWSGYEDEAGNGTTGGKDRNYAVKIDSHAPNLKTRFPAPNPAP